MKLNSLLVSLTSLSLLTISCANTQNQSTATYLSNNTAKPEMHKNYDSTKWYRTSAEKTALYRQIFSLADEKITANVKKQKLAKNT